MAQKAKHRLCLQEAQVQYLALHGPQAILGVIPKHTARNSPWARWVTLSKNFIKKTALKTKKQENSNSEILNLDKVLGPWKRYYG